MKALSNRSFGICLATPFRGPLAAALLACCSIIVPTAIGRPGGAQPPAKSFDLPKTGQETDQPVAGGDLHEWHIDLAAAEFLQVAVEPFDIDLAVAAIAPDDTVVSESTEPHVTLSIDASYRTVASFIADRPGRYRLRVLPRDKTASPAHYRLRVEARDLASQADRQRLAAHRLWSEGMRLFQQGPEEAKQAAIAKYEDALRLLDEIGDQEGVALTLGTIAAIWYELSDASQASAAREQALEVWRRLGREREEGIALSDLGLLAYLEYNHALARTYYERALPKHQATRDLQAEARTLVRLGWSHNSAGEPTKVVDLNQQALALWREVDDRSGEATSYSDLGRAYVDLGNVSQALDAYGSALAAFDRTPRNAASVLVRIGLLYLSIAEWQRALDALHQALALARRANDTRGEVTVLVNLGSAYIRIGDNREALRYLEPALALSRRIAFRSAEANVLTSLGIVSRMNNELDRSDDYFHQALAIQTSVGDVRSEVNTLRQLASSQLASGTPREALESITRSLEKSALTPNAWGLATLADVYAELGDAPNAQASYQQALARAREVRDRGAEANALALFGRFQARQGRYAEARDLLREALAVRESLRSLIVDPDLRMSYSSLSLGPYQQYIDVLMEMEHRSPGSGFAAEAFHTNERARARGLLDLLSASGVDIRQGADPALVARERTLRWSLNAKAALQTSLLSGRRNDARLEAIEKELADLSSELRETTTRIRQESPLYAALVAPQPLTASEIGQLLAADTVLLEFALGETRSWLFAVTSTSFEAFPLPARQTIEDAAREVYRLITSRQPVGGETAVQRQARTRRMDAELVHRSRALSELVLEPVGAKLADEWRGHRLVIVVGGALEYVPFGALSLPGRVQGSKQGDTPLIRTHEVVALPSASILPLLRHQTGIRTPAPRKTIAVLADPVFASDDPRVSKMQREPRTTNAELETPASRTDDQSATHSVATRALEPFTVDAARGVLSRLPFTRAEAQAVTALVPQTSVLRAVDFEASLQLAMSGRLAGYRIVHFATHGLINTRHPELSGLALSLVDAQGRRQDGFLRLNSIYNLRLSADLVVLSACESALGKEISGEGLVGLTRGFMFAGTPRVVASLWQVSDLATAELMKKFYTGMLQQGTPPAAALRRAQLEMAKDPRWKSPYFWAGFILQGDWK
jgi:CHAT domain-containing protein/tetratricopeptide (TPR) repeat protein